jgi:hypothetical protein
MKKNRSKVSKRKKKVIKRQKERTKYKFWKARRRIKSFTIFTLENREKRER